jgi:oxygen-independent coproporphyrinogen III oxidase
MNALYKQLENNIYKNIKNKNQKIETIFIGGGTPSTIKYQLYEKIFLLIKPYMSKNIEITTEANPNSATKNWLEGMYSLGVNRISFGTQTFNDEKLKILGRAHNSNKSFEAIKNARSVGFDNINCDIIYGVKGDTFENLKKDFDIVSSLEINHISSYSLTIEENTKFFNTPHIKIDDENLSKNIFEYLDKLGFNQYEISNFSKSNKYISKHNKGYWEHKEYLGGGCGAVGYINKQRHYPSKNLEKYINNPLFTDIEILNNKDIKMEKVLLGIRSYIGVDINIFTQNELNRLDILVKDKKIKIVNEKIVNNNFLIADELALYILD